MKTARIAPFVLSGGAGTRLWPVSRAGMAKQLVPVVSETTLLQKTVARLEGVSSFDSATVIGRFDDRFVLRDQLSAIDSNASIVVEPVRRDTLAAVLLAAEIAAVYKPGAVVAVVPSDHLVSDNASFVAAIEQAALAVETSGIAVVGVEPDEPSSAFGYIMPGVEVAEGFRSVARFIEKPDRVTASKLVTESKCLWNAGIFCFNPVWLIDQVRMLEPETVAAVAESVRAATDDLGFIVPSPRFAQAREISFDHAFMENTQDAVVVPAAFNWSDVGDWKAVWEAADQDENGVAARGDVVSINSQNCLVHSTHKLVCTVGLKNIAVVETPDALLVLSLDCAQDVKTLVKTLEKAGRTEALDHVRSFRPWGWYQTMDLGERFRVKRISVKPGAKLSLQRHHHRAEHWIVVRGTADVTVGSDVQRVHENQSVYIPIGELHRLSNPGKIDLELIEVQSGSYLEEDDIERFDDTFGRATYPYAALAAE